MKRTLFVLTIALLLLVACAPSPTATPLPAPTTTLPLAPTATLLPPATPTAAAIPTNTPTSTATPRPQARVIADNTPFYSGPGNIGYETLAQLPKGTQTTPIGVFGDFVKVQVNANDSMREGFVLNKALDILPANVIVLDDNQVPWRKKYSNLLRSIYDPRAVIQDDVLSVDNTNGNDWYGAEEVGPIPLDGRFKINLSLDKSTGEFASITLSGRIYETGPWWNGIIRLIVANNRNALVLQIQDGKSETSTLNIPLRTLSPRTPFSLVFQDANGKQLSVVDSNGKVIQTFDVTKLSGTTLPNGLFPDSRLYLGILIAAKSQLVVTGLELLEPPNGTEVKEQRMSLRELAEKRGFEIGAAGLGGIYAFRDPRYSEILATEFNRLVLEDFQWSYIRPSRDTYDFSATDIMVNYGTKHHMRIEGHHLAWGDADHLPQWLKSGNFSRDELIAILRDHVTTVVSRYKGKVQAWTVANEVVSRTIWGDSDADFWYKRIGPDYVEMVFRWAREADPNATLIYNQDDDEDRSNPISSKISNGTYDLIKQLKQKGVPVDGIGMQMHLLSPFAGDKVNPPKKEDVIANMRRFAELGVQIYVTEFDVNLTNVAGTPAEKRTFQARVYKDMLEACLESGVCKAFSIFGFTDLVTWYNVCDGCLNLPNAEPLPLDRNYQPKPAYFALRDVLTGK